jgi:putative membrane protein
LAATGSGSLPSQAGNLTAGARHPMIRSYNDHAANERTFLAWVRAALSAIGLGVIIEKSALLALAIGAPNEPAIGYLSNCGGPALIGTGVVVIVGAGVRFVRTALRIDDPNVHPAGIVRLASALSRCRRRESGATRAVRQLPIPRSASGRRDFRIALRGGIRRKALTLATITSGRGLPSHDD